MTIRLRFSTPFLNTDKFREVNDLRLEENKR
jgi:hypothetical protein